MGSKYFSRLRELNDLLTISFFYLMYTTSFPASSRRSKWRLREDPCKQLGSRDPKLANHRPVSILKTAKISNILGNS